MSTVIAIRPYEPADLDALYEICLATGHRGNDASHLYRNGKLMGHIFAAPHAMLEPDFALVVADAHGVAGFAVGAPDTNDWFKRLENESWPSLRTLYEDPGEVRCPCRAGPPISGAPS